MLHRVTAFVIIGLLLAGGVAGEKLPSNSSAVDATDAFSNFQTASHTSVEGSNSSNKAPVANSGTQIASASDDYVYWKTVRARVTAYEPSRVSCGKFADGKTSIGKNAWRMDGVAADPSAIPYGSIVHIPGVGFKTVDDTGSQMRKSWRKGVYHIDLRMPYIYQARRWGNRYMNIKLYRQRV